MEPKVFSVGQINRYVKNMLEEDVILSNLWVKGEISNFKAHPTGHFYFTLKDKSGAVSCVMFREQASLLPYVPENGMEVVIFGHVSLYDKTGQYQLYIEGMEPIGLGAKNLAFLQLKEKLEEEGLFDEDFKREITAYPTTIAVITAGSGAAVRDVLKIIKRRNAKVAIVVVPVLVQGEYAVDSIVSGLRLVNEWGKADTIILGRGGGSLEDLWAFNGEKVARAIFASETPVISGVGHETDVTIADFVADLRASTPSAAAELATTDLTETLSRLEQLERKLKGQLTQQIVTGEEKLVSLCSRPVLKRPLEKIQNIEVYLQQLQNRSENKVCYGMEKAMMHYEHLQRRLEAGSPLSLLKRGYAMVSDEKGKVLTKVSQMKEEDTVVFTMADGTAKAVITQRQVEAKHGEKEDAI